MAKRGWRTGPVGIGGQVGTSAPKAERKRPAKTPRQAPPFPDASPDYLGYQAQTARQKTAYETSPPVGPDLLDQLLGVFGGAVKSQATKVAREIRSPLDKPEPGKSALSSAYAGVGKALVGSSLFDWLEGREASGQEVVLDALFMLPFLRPIRGARIAARAAGKGVARALPKGAEKAARTITVGEKAIQLPAARSRITKQVEKAADKVSEAFPNVPLAGTNARGAKALGKQNLLNASREIAKLQQHIKAIPKEDTIEDVAHFWWAQLPKKLRNTKGLGAVRAAQQTELDEITSGRAMEEVSEQIYNKRAALLATRWGGKVERVPVTVMEPGVVVRAADRDNVGRIVSVGNDTADVYFLNTIERTEATVTLPKRLLTPTGVRISVIGGEEESLSSGSEIWALMDEIEDLRILASDLPEIQKDLTAAISQLDGVIAKPPRLDPRIINSVHALSGDRRPLLEAAGVLDPGRATWRQGLVSRWLGVEPTGEEAFIGHRLFGQKVKGAQQSGLSVAVGTGRVRLPEGVARENKLVRVKTGRVRASTRVAVEDWQAAQVFRNALTARDDLGKMGTAFTRSKPEDHYLINPKGRAVPKEWRSERLGEIIAADFDDDAIREAAKEINAGFVAGPGDDWDALVAAAKEQGVRWNELRVVPKKIVDRYYAQFTPAGGRNVLGKGYDVAVDFTAASIVFARLGYIPKNIVQNLVMTAPHQGVFFPINALRVSQLIPHQGQSFADRQLWNILANEAAGGATHALVAEARYAGKLKGVPGGVAHVVTSVADTPIRISALIHELAAAKVIPKFKPWLDDADKATLLKFYEKPPPLANDVRSRTVEAMADFTRLNPTQRRWARRFFVIPGWLWAGSRYPVHFAATHPVRAAAMAYAAAGWPGVSDEYAPNKSIDEYFAKGVPSFVEGLDIGGKILRTGSLSPVSTPWEISAALSGRGDRRALDYGSPFGISTAQIAGGLGWGPNGPYETDYPTALRQVGERLVPNVKLARDLVNPPSNPKYYPEDTSRLGRIKRELGVVPIEVTREAGGSSGARVDTGRSRLSGRSSKRGWRTGR